MSCLATKALPKAYSIPAQALPGLPLAAVE